MANLHQQSALNLARKVLAASTRKQDQQTVLAELTQVLAKTNPPLFQPRVPRAFTASLQQQQGLSTIRERASVILPEMGLPAAQTHSILQNSEINQTYGTTPVETIYTLLDVLYPDSTTTSSGTFIDAGSGMGVPTLAAALSNKFPFARGIEYEPKWHHPALALRKAYEEQQNQDCELEYICGDTSTNGTFSGGSCVFLNCVVWDAKLCRKVSETLEDDLAPDHHKKDKEDVFVVSMSRRLALPSFDLVDVLSLRANEGMFTMYVNRMAGNPESRFYATSDSQDVRSLQEESDSLVEILVETALLAEDERTGMEFLVTLAASETCTRTIGQNQQLWSTLIQSMDPDSGLQSKVLGSMVLRAMVDHPIGRRKVSEEVHLVGLLLSVIGNDTMHPAVRTNLLDVLSNILYDSPLDSFSNELDEMLGKLVAEPSNVDMTNVSEAVSEVVIMRRWWEGHQREIPT